jgi:hypothetical protein
MARGHDGHKDGQECISAIKTAREDVDVSSIEMARRAWRRSKRETEGRGQDILLGRLKIGERASSCTLHPQADKDHLVQSISVKCR